MIFRISIIFILIVVLLFFSKRLKVTATTNYFLPLAFIFKVFIGFIFLYIYSYHYGDGQLTDDAGVYMRESKILHDVSSASKTDYFKLIFEIGDEEKLVQQHLMETDHWDMGEQALLNDSKNMIKTHSFIQFISGNSPPIHMMIMCLLSLIGIVLLTKSLKNYSEIKEKYIFVLIFLFPSILFWSSGILKEPFLLLGLGFISYSTLHLKNYSRKRFIYFISGMLIITLFKSYLLLPIVVSFAFYMLLKKMRLIYAFIVIITLPILFSLIFKNESQKATDYLSRKQFDFNNIARGGLHADNGKTFYYFRPDQISDLTLEGDSVSLHKEIDALILQHGQMAKPIPVHLYPSQEKWHVYFQNPACTGFIETTPIKSSKIQLIKNIPEAMMNALVRPFIWDPGSKLKYPAVLEILVLYILLIYAIIKRRKIDSKHSKIIYSLILFSICLALIIGWTTPVLGAISRYRIPILIAILIIITQLIQVPKLLLRDSDAR